MGKPTYPNVRLEIDASDISNLISNHSGQAGVTTGWTATAGYTLAAVTNPSRSSQVLTGTYTGGKTIAVTAASGRASTATVTSPKFAVVTGQWVGAQIDIATSVLSSGTSQLLVYGAIQYFDASNNPVGFLGFGPGDLVVEDSSIAGWATVTFAPNVFTPSGAVPSTATQASLVFKFARKNPNTAVITYPAETIYLTKAMAVCADNLLKVTNVPFADPGAVYQIITANVTHMSFVRGGDVSGVEDEMAVGILSATLRDFEVDPNRNPRIRKNRLMRMSSPNSSGVWEPLFTGRLDHMTVSYVDKMNQSAAPTVTLTAVDAISELTATNAFYGYSGTIGQQVRAVIADSGYAGSYTTDAGAISTTKITVDENGKLWDQLRLIRNNTINAKLYVDRYNVLQCKTQTSSTAAYTFTDRDKIKLLNQIYDPYYTSGQANAKGYFHSDYSQWSTALSSEVTLDGPVVVLAKAAGTPTTGVMRWHPYTGATLGFYTAGALGAKAGERVSIKVPVKALQACRIRLTYGALGSTQTVYADLIVNEVTTLNLNNIVSPGADYDGSNPMDQITVSASISGTDNPITGSGNVMMIGRMVAYNSGMVIVPGTSAIDPFGAGPPTIVDLAYTGTVSYSPQTYVYVPGAYTPYTDADIGFDSKLVANQLTITRHTSAEADGEKVYGPYINQTSRLAWGTVTANVDVLDATPATMAADYLKKFQEPAVAPLSLTLTFDNKKTNEHLIELYTPVRIINNQSQLDKTFYVIGIEQRITGTRWWITYKFRTLDDLTAITVTNPSGGASTGPEDVFSNPGSDAPLIGFAAKIDSSHSLATSGYNGITAYTEVYDTNTAFNPTTGLFVVPEDGLYVLSGAIFFNTNVTGRRFLQIESGTAAAGSNTPLIRQEVSPAAGYVGPCVYLETLLTAGTTVRMVAYQTSGAALAARGDFSPTVFSARKIADTP